MFGCCSNHDKDGHTNKQMSLFIESVGGQHWFGQQGMLDCVLCAILVACAVGPCQRGRFRVHQATMMIATRLKSCQHSSYLCSLSIPNHYFPPTTTS
eukprot:m.31284 g.31284  ORF g.31284 m.31284 type:complete len:97 (-) comp9710_c0_seq1:844-1134(-)